MDRGNCSTPFPGGDHFLGHIHYQEVGACCKEPLGQRKGRETIGQYRVTFESLAVQE